MDRCPKCRAQLAFIGIATRPAGTWSRWLTCPVCSVNVSTSDTGDLRYVGIADPDPKIFVTLEVRSHR
jgi:hypothetical protein